MLSRPFMLSRSLTFQAPPELVHLLINDFKHWKMWSPWEGRDLAIQRNYTGPEAGVGTRYTWSDNSKASQGAMEIVTSTTSQLVIELELLKPIQTISLTTFDLEKTISGGTRVVWSITGTRNPLRWVVGRVGFDREMQRHFAHGLARLRAIADNH